MGASSKSIGNVTKITIFYVNAKYFQHGRRSDPQVSGPHKTAQVPAQEPAQVVRGEGGKSLKK